MQYFLFCDDAIFIRCRTESSWVEFEGFDFGLRFNSFKSGSCWSDLSKKRSEYFSNAESYIFKYY